MESTGNADSRSGTGAGWAIRCEDLGFSYPDGTKAIDGVSLQLGMGQLLCLLGPNGSGKSTLVRLVTTQLRPAEGSVQVLGEAAHRNPAATKRSLGITPQSTLTGPSLYVGLTVETHLRLFAPFKGISSEKADSEVDRVVSICELSDCREKRIRQLSGGQQRKVLLALALLGDPPVLVLDEPTVGLDPAARRQLWQTVEAERTRGKSILLTTHYLDEAERLSDQLAILVDGRVRIAGSLKELLAAMPTPYRVVCDDEGGRGRYPFRTLEEAQAFVVERGMKTYSVGRMSLEDLYFDLIGDPEEDGAEEGALP